MGGRRRSVKPSASEGSPFSAPPHITTCPHRCQSPPCVSVVLLVCGVSHMTHIGPFTCEQNCVFGSIHTNEAHKTLAGTQLQSHGQGIAWNSFELALALSVWFHRDSVALSEVNECPPFPFPPSLTQWTSHLYHVHRTSDSSSDLALWSPQVTRKRPPKEARLCCLILCCVR